MKQSTSKGGMGASDTNSEAQEQEESDDEQELGMVHND